MRISIALMVKDLLPKGVAGIARLPFPSLLLVRVNPKLSMESLIPNPSTLGVEYCLTGVNACCMLKLLLINRVGV